MIKRSLRNLFVVAISFSVLTGILYSLPVHPAIASASTEAALSLTGELTRGDGRLQLDVTVENLVDYSGDAYVVFELLDGDTPLLINAVPIQQNKMNMTQYFNVSGDSYKVKVFVFDQFNSDFKLPTSLARPMVFQ